MRLFRLEIKRILKSRRTLIILAIALLLSVAMAYLPISFEGINRPNEDGTVTELDGLAAIKYKQDLYKTSAGEVTPDRIKSALETYQSCVREYGPVEEEGFPLAVYIEKIVPFRHLLIITLGSKVTTIATVIVPVYAVVCLIFQPILYRVYQKVEIK